ncbi:unnamed protein product [Fraxinus pennsylvanica]|uniref:Uncharacterized protein n=1 Tax=Fraxinus pennsylvanica TaxID=56036 RepID=A0AAD2A9Y9_9LAMI|nr:unnamed protein product [Fraxinus pennsylvanica]
MLGLLPYYSNKRKVSTIDDEIASRISTDTWCRNSLSWLLKERPPWALTGLPFFPTTSTRWFACVVRRSGWTMDIDIFFQWLSAIPFSGGGFNDAPSQKV